jgi:hypothetical protein
MFKKSIMFILDVGRLSPVAKEDIYNLHLNGWSVRDISVR